MVTFKNSLYFLSIFIRLFYGGSFKPWFAERNQRRSLDPLNPFEHINPFGDNPKLLIYPVYATHVNIVNHINMLTIIIIMLSIIF